MLLKSELEREREKNPGCLGSWVQFSMACLLHPAHHDHPAIPISKVVQESPSRSYKHCKHKPSRGVLLMDYWAACGPRQPGQTCSEALSMSWRSSGGEARSVQRPVPVCVFQLYPFTVLIHSLHVLSHGRSDLILLMSTPALVTCLWLPASSNPLRHSGMEELLDLGLLLASAAMLLTEPLCLHL